MIDVEAVRANADLVEVVSRYVQGLKKSGKEWEACCPFHDERSPSFTVSPDKGFVHCFGCGAHHDVIGFVMRADGCTFVEACEKLGAKDFAKAVAPTIRKVARRQRDLGEPGGLWVPVYPVPDDAPRFAVGEAGRVWNPKRGSWWNVRPSRADAYRDAAGRLMGYVLRVEFSDGQKVTPQVTWCIGPAGEMQWCTRPFPTPRPLCGLDDLAREVVTIVGPNGSRCAWVRPGEVFDLALDERVECVEFPPVLVVEGEKCRAAGAGALPMYAVVAWAGGSKGVRYADWSPLKDRDVVLWPDADAPGRDAMLGSMHYDGTWTDGVAQHAHAAGCRSIRFVDTGGRPKGWDIADAIDEGWTPKQLAVWAAMRVKDVVMDARAAA